MKKIISIMLVMCFLLTLCACSGTETEANAETNNTKPGVTPTEGNTPDPTDAPAPEQDSGVLAGTFKVPLQEIYVDVPDYHHTENGFTEVYWDGETKYVAFACYYTETAEDLQSSYDTAIDLFRKNIDAQHHIDSLGDIAMETVTVNGIEAYKFEGLVNAGRDARYEAYVYGYSFIYNTFPTLIIGVVKDEAQPEAEKVEAREVVDAMMNTVRSKP